MIIALSGRAGSGKNYIASRYLVPIGFRDLALADEIKIRAVATGIASFEEAFHTKPESVRKWLQEEGTERGRDVFGEDCWCRALGARVSLMRERWGLTDFVITDVRFPNEVAYVQRQLRGHVYKIVAPGRVAASPLTEAQREHRSELSVDTLDPLVDGFILNDPLDSTSVEWQIARHLRSLGRPEVEDSLVERPSYADRAMLLREMIN